MEHPLFRRLVIFGLLLFPLSHTANAELIGSETDLQVRIRVDTIEELEVPVLPGSTQSVQVSQVSSATVFPSRAASSEGAVTLNDATSGTASFLGSFQKSPLNFSGGFASTTGRLAYSFEIDVAGTLFLETANAASFQDSGDIGAFAPAWIFNGTSVDSSGLNSMDSWSIDFQAGNHELVLDAAGSGAVWAAGSIASGEFSTIFNWGIGSLPGTLENPILPTELGPGDFGFSIVTTEDNRFYDPIIATGYDYVATDVPFASVLVPEALPNGDSEFQLLVGSQTFALNAGDTFDLTTIAPGGVIEFGIRGIDTNEMIDPNDPTAFVTGLSFAQGGVASSFSMTAVSIPEPSSCIAIGIFGGSAAIHRRQRRRAAHS